MFTIYGPPGTGKTTTLLDMVEKALEEGIAPSRIAFLAFTRKAAREARERAARRFKLDIDNDLSSFKTLHSFCYHLSDINQEQLMTPDHIAEFSQEIGFNLTSKNLNDDDDIGANSKDNPIMQVIQLARLKKQAIESAYSQSTIDEPLTTVLFVDNAYRSYKAANRLYDYTDILEWFSENGGRVCPSFDLVFLDEAQDLSPLQWEIAHVLDDNSNRMYVAGDDDQAIYRWAGADVEHFLGIEEGSEVLSQSYRVPRAVFNIAKRISHRIKTRRPKEYAPKPEDGKVDNVFGPPMTLLMENDWLIMAQCNYMLNETCDVMRQYGYYFENRGNKSISEKLSSALVSWKALVAGGEVDAHSARNLYYYMKSGTRIKRGFKTLSNIDVKDTFSLKHLQEHCGLLATEDMAWDEAMDRIPEDVKTYVAALLRRGEDLTREPRIKVSTIHGSKGGEAANVVLFTDISYASDQAVSSNTLEGSKMMDDLHRLFYVGVTRCSQNLYIVSPVDGLRSYTI
jgi:superfamily I DNA/RNA helicase